MRNGAFNIVDYEQLEGRNVARREMSTDPRAVRTRATLIQATIDLLKTHRAETLSVSQIVKTGNLSRQVFYEHFADRDALLFAAAEKMIAPALEWTYTASNETKLLQKIVEALNQTARSYGDSLRNLCDGPIHWQVHSLAVQRMWPIMESEIAQRLNETGHQKPDEHIRCTAEFVASGVVERLTAAVRDQKSLEDVRRDLAMVRDTLSALDYGTP